MGSRMLAFSGWKSMQTGSFNMPLCRVNPHHHRQPPHVADRETEHGAEFQELLLGGSGDEGAKYSFQVLLMENHCQIATKATPTQIKTRSVNGLLVNS